MRQGMACLICTLLWTSLAGGQDLREQAAQAWERAVQEELAFRTLPPESRTRNAHLRIIQLYERVYLTTPHSGYSDDALINIATLYEETEAIPDALRTLRFLVSDYPASKHVPEARSRIDRLSGDTSIPPGGALAATTGSAGDALPAAVEINPTPRAAGSASVDGIRYWEQDDSLRVVVDMTGQPVFRRGSLSNPPRVYLDIDGRLGDLGQRELRVDSLMLRGIRVAQNDPDTVRVVLDLEGLTSVDTFTLTDPNRLVIDVVGGALAGTPLPAEAAPVPVTPTVAAPEAGVRADSPAPPPAAVAETVPAPQSGATSTPALPTENGDITLSRSLGLKPRRVVIDPGHGGYDPGTIGPSGLSEAELVLALANLLRERLETELPGVEVLLTREDDTFVPLEARPAAANQAGADLFISIHANSSRTRSIRGFETYFLNLNSSPDAMEIAARENAASERAFSDLQDIISQIMMQDWAEESREFAGHIQRALASRSDLGRDRGVKQAPLVVLLGANMPSILAEISFISNPEDELLLKGVERRQQIADALFEGVRSYFGALNGFRTAEARD